MKHSAPFARPWRRDLSAVPLVVRLGLPALAASVLVPTTAHAQMSESEKKSAARAAFQEGVTLQQQGKIAEALARFQAGEKLYDAPTISVRVAQCQVLLGKLVQGAETYEALTRKELGPNPPDAFVEAQKQAEAALPGVRQRIPTLRVTLKPEPSTLTNLRVVENDTQMPVELVGIARPVNPGTYRISAEADGWATEAPVELKISEREKKNLELVLVQRSGTATTPVAAPAPYYPTVAGAGAGTAAGYTYPPAKPKSSASGLLLGARGGVFIPGGKDAQDNNLTQSVRAGAGLGLDAIFRFQHSLLLGLTFEYAGLGTKPYSPVAASTMKSADTLYLGGSVGVLPNIDATSFIGSVGLGYRWLSERATLNNNAGLSNTTMGGANVLIDAGLSIPAGPLRIVPKATLATGVFNDLNVCTNSNCTSSDSQDPGLHTVISFTLGIYYAIDTGKKPPAPQPPTTPASTTPASTTTPAPATTTPAPTSQQTSQAL